MLGWTAGQLFGRDQKNNTVVVHLNAIPLMQKNVGPQFKFRGQRIIANHPFVRPLWKDCATS
jgi:hypothetical protein